MKSNPKLAALPQSSGPGASLWLIGALLLAIQVPALGDGRAPRCAIIVNQGSSEHGADASSEGAHENRDNAKSRLGDTVADLLAIRLTENDFITVDRTHLGTVIAERVLAQAFADADPSARRQVGSVAGADLLVLLTTKDKEGKQMVEWTVASMPSGLRLASGASTWNELHADDTLQAILESVRRAQRLSQNEYLQLVCVPAFLCTGPTFDHSGRPETFAKLTEEILLAAPNVAVVALAEVDALKRETQLTAREIVRRVPLTILGSFDTRRVESVLRTTLVIKLLAAGETLGERRLVDVDDAQIAPALSEAITDLLKEHSDVRLQPRSGGEVPVLTDQALAYMEVGALEDAIPLLQTAVLLEPDNLDTRTKLFWAWNGRVSTMVGVKDKVHSVERVEMMENTLDEFLEIARRRPVTSEDVWDLNQTRAMGHEYGANKRTAPEFVDRYYEFCNRFRATVRDIYEGKFRTDGEKARQDALRLLIIQLGRESYDTPEPVHAEMLTLIRDLAKEGHKDAEILQILLIAQPLRERSTGVIKDFWNKCCPPDDARMSALADMARALRGPDHKVDAEAFEAALTHAKSTLDLSDHDVARIRDTARKHLGRAELSAKRAAIGPLAVMPRVTELAGVPDRNVTTWLTNDDGSEFVATTEAVYRVTPQRAFEFLHSIDKADIAWDTRYLWLATDEAIEVVDAQGDLLAREEIPARKFMTPMAAGKMFIARHDRSDEGASRTAHEIWTVHAGQIPALQHELLYVADRNWTIGIRQSSKSPPQRRPSLLHGQLIRVHGGRGDFIFFHEYGETLVVDTQEFQTLRRAWPMRGHYFYADGVHYWICGFNECHEAMRARAVFRADDSEFRARLVVDLGWQRYRGHSSCGWQPAAMSAVVHDGWLHFIDRDPLCPPQWVAVNLQSADVRTLAVDVTQLPFEPVKPRHAPQPGAHLIKSPSFGLLLRCGGTIYRVELPPADTWAAYDILVRDLRVSPEDVVLDPWGGGYDGDTVAPPPP